MSALYLRIRIARKVVSRVQHNRLAKKEIRHSFLLRMHDTERLMRLPLSFCEIWEVNCLASVREECFRQCEHHAPRRSFTDVRTHRLALCKTLHESVTLDEIHAVIFHTQGLLTKLFP